MRWMLIAAVVFAVSVAVAEDKKDDAKTTAVKKDWKKLKPAFKTGQEAFDPLPDFQADGKVVLANRGAIVSVNEQGPVTVSFGWKWTQGDDETGKYPDHLSVALRSNGKQKAKWPCEVESGLVVRLVPNAGGSIVVEEFKDGEGQGPLVSVAHGFKKGTTYKVSIADEGKELKISIDEKQVFSLKVAEGKGHVTIYDREPANGAQKESVLEGLTLKEMVKRD